MILLVSALVWLRGWYPFMDDGPFIGSARTTFPEGKADQEFKIYAGNTLYVYDPREGEPAPTVALRDSRNEIRWCIYATGMEGTTVHKLRFTSFRRFPFFDPRVRGYVEWTFGHEAMWWFISSDGKLKEYWYSW